MSEQKQKIYSTEFKESSVKLAIESAQPMAYTARELGATIYKWLLDALLIQILMTKVAWLYFLSKLNKVYNALLFYDNKLFDYDMEILAKL